MVQLLLAGGPHFSRNVPACWIASEKSMAGEIPTLQQVTCFFPRNFADFSLDHENLRTLLGYAHLWVFSHQSKLGFSEPFNRSLRCFFNSRTFFFYRCNLSSLFTGSVFANFPTCYNLFLTPESIPVEFFVCLFCGHPQTGIVAKKFESPCAHILN